MKARLGLLAAALWWGSLSTVGFMVVPMLFAHLASPAVAGNMAGKLFAAQTWLSAGCAVVLLMAVRARIEESGAAAVQTELMLVAGGLMLALMQEFAVAPRILAREDLRLWHTVGSVMYGLQWLCAGAVLWRAGAGVSGRPSS